MMAYGLGRKIATSIQSLNRQTPRPIQKLIN